MRSRILVTFLAVFALVTGVVAASPPPRAEALTAGLPFTADPLSTWQTNGIVWALAASHGKVVAGGKFSAVRPPDGQSGTATSASALVIYDAATGRPDSCQLPVGFTGGTPIVYAAATAADGDTVFIGGNFSSVGGVSISRLAEIDVVNCRVTSFRAGAISSYVLSLAPTADALYVGGFFKTFAGQDRRAFAKVTLSGSMTSWVANATGTTVEKYDSTIVPDGFSRGTAVTVSPDGSKVALGGDFFAVNGSNTHSIAVVNGSTGAVLRSYPGYVQNTSRTQALASDGVNFYAGNEGSNAFDGRFAVSWATLNPVWRDNCLGAVQTVLVTDGLLYSGHHNHNCAAQGMFPDGKRTYLSVTDVNDPAQIKKVWMPDLNDGTGEGLGPRALAVASVGGSRQLWVGGEFTKVNGALQQSITRFGTTDTGNPAVPALTATPVGERSVQVAIRTVYDRDDGDITYSVYRGSNTTTPVWTGVAGSQWWYRPQVTFVDSGLTAGASYVYRVRATDAAGNQSALSGAVSVVAPSAGSAYASTVIADNPRMYLRYDDPPNSSWVVDSAGQTVVGMNGIAQNGVTRGATGALLGDNSKSATFDDSLSQYIWNDQIEMSPTVYSVETWFKTSSTSGGQLVGYGDGRPRTDSGADVLSSGYTNGGTPYTFVTNTYDRTVYMEAGTGRLRFAVRAPSTVQSLRTPAAYNDNQWHHVVATQGAQGMRLYIDGALVAQNSVTQTKPYYGMWHVGGDNLNGFPNTGSSTANRFFDGQLDETAVYYDVLSGAQVAGHYALADGTDTTAPTVPGGVAAAQTGAGTVTVTWNASSDAVGVTGYSIHRGTTASFTPNSGNLVGQVGAVTTYQDTPVTQGTWFYRVIARDGSGNASAASTAGSVTVAPVDSEPPTTPGALQAALVGADVQLTWEASSDNVAVSGYDVFRGTTAGFTADAGSRIAQVGATTYADAARPAGTWFYRVAARDAQGNLSDPSPAESVTVIEPVDISVSPTDDTMVAQLAPNSIYGATNQLSSRATSGTILSYIRVNVPSAPAGTVLTGVTLRVRTSDDSTAASAEDHLFRLMSAGWDEATVTWNNRPADVSGDVVGTLTGANARNTPYSVALDAQDFQSLLGSTTSLVMFGTGADNLRIWSSDAASASYRPVVTFSFTPTT